MFKNTAKQCIAYVCCVHSTVRLFTWRGWHFSSTSTAEHEYMCTHVEIIYLWSKL